MNKKLNVAIGGDHGGYELKEALAAHLKSQGHTVEDCGTHNKGAAATPPPAAVPVPPPPAAMPPPPAAVPVPPPPA